MSTGIGGSAAVVIASIVIIGLFLSLVAIENPSILGLPTATTTTTVTKQSTVTTEVTLNGNVVDLASSSNYSLFNLNPEQIYASSNRSIVTLEGMQSQSSVFGQQMITVLGSGFVIQYSGSFYIVTNYHVAGATTNLTVTFPDGDAYSAKVVGSDPYADLAIVSASQAPLSEFYPLSVVPSSSLKVGQSIVAIGNPFGLSGSMTVGIISQLGRTLQDPTAGNFSIANVIQFSAPINPGNSGGPLIDSNGNVVGITTAIVGGSQGLGFAIPSDTILREIPSLVVNGTYTKHSYLGIGGVDMNYQLSRAAGTNYTYGDLVETVVPGGPSSNSGLRGGSNLVTVEGQQYSVGGDIIVSVNGSRIINTDALGTYLEEHTVPGEIAVLGIIRSGTFMTVNVTLGARPPVSS